MVAFTRGEEARELFDQGLGCNAIAKALGVSPSTISSWAKREKLSFDRSQVAAANEAKVIDGRARRLELIERGYTFALHLYDVLQAPSFKTLVRGEGGAEMVRELDFVPAPNLRDITHAISMQAATVTRLEALNGDATTDHAKSLLTELGRALGVTPD